MCDASCELAHTSTQDWYHQTRLDIVVLVRNIPLPVACGIQPYIFQGLIIPLNPTQTKMHLASQGLVFGDH